MPPSMLRLNPRDGVAVAVRDLTPGEVIRLGGGEPIEVREPIPAGHKMAVYAIPQGMPVLKYGEPIGMASRPIGAGNWVHRQNLIYAERPVRFPALPAEAPDAASGLHGEGPWSEATFAGFVRENGKVGTRNYIAVVSSVNCSASVCQWVADRFPPDRLARFPNIDGVVAITHEGGCGMPRRGLQQTMLQRVLRGVMEHPNVAACLCIGLGCEQTPAPELVTLDLQSSPPDSKSSRDGFPKILVMQQQGGTGRTIETAASVIESWLPGIDAQRRQPVPLSHLVVATECGGSDAFSGITANRVVGGVVDRLVAAGAVGVLSETSEVTGAEAGLLRRAVSRDVAERLIERLQWWRWYVNLFDASLDENPSPGNEAGGLTTIAEKSLGAVQKGGTMPLVDVLEYAQPITRKGFVFMDTPGYDPPSVTGMVAGGANLVLFTTGRGSCFGCALAPTIKISSTSGLAARMPDDIDFDAGSILAGEAADVLAEQLLQRVIAVASGEPTCSERQGYGRHEFVPWHVGPVL